MTRGISKRSGRRRVAIAGIAACAALLSACGSSSSNVGSSASSTAATTVTSAAPSGMSSASGQADSAMSGTSSQAGSAMSGTSSQAGSAMSGTSSQAGSAMSGTSSEASSAMSNATSDSSTAVSSSASSAATSTNLGLLTPGTLVVGMNLQFKPEMYLDEAGKPAGYDVDLLNALATSLGVKLDIQNLDFNGLIPGLQSKKFDMVSVGLNATDERKKVIDFSRGYVPYTSVLAVRQDDSKAATIDAYNTGGVIITALQGSTGEALAKKTFPKATVNGFPDQNAALLEVATGRAQGSVLEDYILAQFQKANPNKLKPAALSAPLDISYGSWGVQKRNTVLVSALDAFLCKAQTDGTLAALYKKDFGVADFPPMPGGC